ncbi:DNA-binding protein [Mycolicibacterium sp. CH28]|uniref:helix-turn-helix domain-containing protein n=1 Tax=Mycolicibacterium sp. CH28 TaxID=2512237 RepID=UPI00108092BA|nr:helix-turn-helix domain-containing protein [Mycolicibacterium sp. CH28]TGD88560.1 DNA-binding protein [Mycolicibacterium sp. CH28]
MPPGYLDINQFSARSGVSVRMLRLYRDQNRGPVSYKIRGRVMYPPDALEKWIEQQMAESERGGR